MEEKMNMITSHAEKHTEEIVSVISVLVGYLSFPGWVNSLNSVGFSIPVDRCLYETGFRIVNEFCDRFVSSMPSVAKRTPIRYPAKYKSI